MKKYQVIVMSFDGEYKREAPIFGTIAEAAEYSNDLGSKWFFYPFHFIVSGTRVVDAFSPAYVGKYLKTVARIFNKVSKRPDMDGADADKFAIEAWGAPA